MNIHINKIIFFACAMLLLNKSIAQTHSFSTLIINNQSKNKLRIYTNEDFNFIGINQIISNQINDTIMLHHSKPRYFYISHKNSYLDTLLVSPKDTVYIEADSVSVKHFNSKSKLQTEINAIINIKTPFGSKIDSLRYIFYKPNISKKIEGFNDYSKFVVYGVTVDRTAFINKQKELNLLLDLLDNDFNYKLDVIKKLGNEQKDFLRDKFNYDYFIELSNLHSYSGSLMIKNKMYSEIFINQNLLSNSFCEKILGAFLKSKTLNSNKQTQKDYKDYKPVYDTMNQYFKGELLKYLHFKCIEKMIEYNETEKSIQLYYNKFLVHNDTRLDTYLNSRISQLIGGKAYDVSHVFIKDADDKITTLNKLLSDSKKKLVYIDFWASWCIPCREAMPYSKKIREKYDKVLFVYLSIDNNFLAWKEASIQEKLPQMNSFLVLNLKSSNFIKQLDLKTIPRYILMNSNGKILTGSAPGPESTEIEKMFNSYLK
jgi:thiol-disulfide isomerase/thioredoxin